MPIDFVSPGNPGFPDRTVPVPIRGGVPDTSVLGKFPSKKALQSGSVQVFRPAVGFDIVITGLNVVAEHWLAMDALIPEAIWSIQNQAGIEMTKEARVRITQYNAVDSGDTLRSIHHVMSTTSNEVITSVGPTTFYAPFIEYGLAFHPGPRPFMMDAMFAIVPEWIRAFNSLAVLAKRGANARLKSGAYRPVLQGVLARWRERLYTLEKALGDIAPLGAVGFRIPGTSVFRQNILSGARAIGDIQSVLSRTVNLRFQRRLTGKVTGRLIGVGSRTVFVNKSVTAGPLDVGGRVYNRVAGRAVTKYIDQTRFFGGHG